MKRGLVISIIILIGIIAIGSYYFFSHSSNSKNINSSESIQNEILIQNFAFSPDTITINKGETIVWSNKDSAPHKIVSDSGSELNSESLSNGATYSHTFAVAGTYDYHCGIHTSMKGKVVVK